MNGLPSEIPTDLIAQRVDEIGLLLAEAEIKSTSGFSPTYSAGSNAEATGRDNRDKPRPEYVLFEAVKKVLTDPATFEGSSRAEFMRRYGFLAIFDLREDP